jgi:UDP-3-O-[3-hydroxymyristoyl] glucosamine N-acyltransferase
MKIGEGSEIHESAVIADKVQIGQWCTIGENVVIKDNSIIGDKVIIGAATVIGSDGFQFRRIAGRLIHIPSFGGVHIHDGVEIKAGCCIDRASGIGSATIIGKNTKLDDLVFIAHDVKIGERCLIVAHAMIAGLVTIGDDVWIGPGALISDELTIGDKAYITIGAVVTKDVLPCQHVTGNFAIEHMKFIDNLRKIR